MKRYNSNIYIGLKKSEVKERQKNKFVNYDTEVKTKSVGQIVSDNVFTLFNLINLIIALAIISVHSYKNLLFIGIVFCNTIISIIQELNSKRIIDKLKVITSTKAIVVRDGKDVIIRNNEIVLDDIIKYRNGNQVTVDSIIKKGSVEVNESFISGESNNITKIEGDIILSGSYIVSGSCICKVEHVGEDNYTAKISKEAKYIKESNSVIMNTLKKIIKYVSIVIIPLSIILFIKQYNLSNNDISNVVVNTSAAVIAMIPEGLVLLTSTVLFVSIIRLAKKHVLVQELYCIESLARVDTICLDKTGTITEGDMEVIDYKSINKCNHDDLLSVFSNHLKDDNNTMKAIYDKYHNNINLKVINSIPFSSLRKYSAIEIEKKGTFIIGAPEILLRNKYQNIIEKYSNYRVLAFCHSNEILKDKLPGQLECLGVIIIQDKIRKEAVETLNYLKKENIDIKIISGDSSKTVSNIAKRVGLKSIKCFDMSKIKETDNLKEIVNKYNLFTRVNPEQKKDIIISLKACNHNVAMMGDGVNDVLALKEADCSITVSSGSDAALSVSQIVLLNDNFESVPKILNEGRRTINNIERSSTLFLTKTLYATILTIIFLFLPLPYPFQPIQLSLISAITIGVPSFILALEKNNKQISNNYLFNVLRKSIPAAITIIIDVIFVSILTILFKLPSNQMSTMAVILVAFTGFVLLFKLCYPFNKLRLTLYISLLCVFIIAILGLNSFFELVTISFPKFIVICILCLLDIALFTNLTIICEKYLKRRIT